MYVCVLLHAVRAFHSLIHSTINSGVCGAYIVCIFLCDKEILTEEFHLINSIIHLQYKFIEYDVCRCMHVSERASERVKEEKENH